jgi:hypothetical protein
VKTYNVELFWPGKWQLKFPYKCSESTIDNAITSVMESFGYSDKPRHYLSANLNLDPITIGCGLGINRKFYRITMFGVVPTTRKYMMEYHKLVVDRSKSTNMKPESILSLDNLMELASTLSQKKLD